MSLLGIIETLRRNLKGVIVACWVALGLLIVADVVRVVTAGEEHEPAAAAEHTVAPSAEHASTAHELTPDQEHAVATAVDTELEGGHAAHGFWAGAYHIAENVPVFWTLFGFLGCVVIVVVSKSYGHFGVSVREDYYSE